MAHAHTVFAHPGQSGLKARFQQIRDMLERRAVERAVYRRTVQELRVLSDRDLADLGLHRSEIPRIATEAAQQA